MATNDQGVQALPPGTDAGNSELFAGMFYKRVRFDHGRKRWLFYRDNWWAVDTDGELMRLAIRAIRFRLRNAAATSDDDKRKKEIGWAMRSEYLPRLEAMVKLARSNDRLADDGSQWDSDPWVFGAANGIIELRTGILRPGLPSDQITLHTNIAFDPTAKCPRWERFVSEIFDGNPELISYVQRAVGYTLAGATTEQCFFCCHGDGANGKSTFLNAIRYALGDYALNLPFSAFELKARSSIPNDVATLPGRRFVTAIETDESARLNEARIKALTGGDPVTARLLNHEFFTFNPVAKFWLAFNHRPIVTDDSHGFWRRVHQIPFLRQFDIKAEPQLEQVLRAEAPGILAWAVRGCLEWQTDGLNLPAAVKEATQAYREESDPLQDFLAERCTFHSDTMSTAAVLWRGYVEWTLQNLERYPLRRSAFTRRLEAMGLRKVRYGHDRTWTWLGICLQGSTEAMILESEADARTDADVKLQ